ncbi:MAG: hypothetical protein ABJF01_20300 [bacterium]
MTRRRNFLAQMGVAAAAFAFDADEMRAETTSGASGPWDTSWLDRLAAAQYRVVFNGNEMNDGEVMSYAATFFDHYHEVHNTTDAQTRPVIVFRRLGTSLAINDAMWDRYAIGEDRKIEDSVTRAPARRNIYWRAGPSGDSSSTIETLHKRGMISLVCNVALGNVGRRLAERTKQKVEDVQTELRANLVPGAILVPSGIYALIRAQNAGCAFMPGT